MNPHTYTLSQLHAAGRAVVVPFMLPLRDGRLLHVENILRLLPGKRVVARAVIDGRVVLTKIFFMREHWQRECEAFKRLRDKGIRTPEMLEAIDEGTAGLCLHEFLTDAQTLSQQWRQGNQTQRQKALQMLLDAQQALYNAGLLQTDLHPGNVMQRGEQWYVLDPASCRPLRNREDRDDNLALLLAQWPLAEWSFVAKQITQQFADSDVNALRKRARKHWQQRQRSYLQKIFRDCTEIADLSNDRVHILCTRHFLDAGLRELIAKLPASLQDAQVLKAGNSATVFCVDVGGQSFVCKRYRDKDIWRKLRRLLRPSRAARSWYFSHALAFAGIDVPAPVALVESGPRWNRDTWFISERACGTDLLSHWQQHTPTEAELVTVKNLFRTLAQAQLSHGDMKATNLIVNEKCLYLIDYDGMQQHGSPAAARRALHRDRERFLRNWPDAALRERLQSLRQEEAA